MKISLNWIFDHIKGELGTIDIAQLVSKFIQTTAEIEEWKKVGVTVDELTLAQVTTVADTGVTLHSPEYKKEYTLPKRVDAAVGSWFIIMDSGTTKRWATSVVFGGSKEMVLPAIHCPEHMHAGGWKSIIELQDYIIDVDNKSINSRPDLWGHRGLAREIAAILNLPLRPLEEFIVQKDSLAYKNAVEATKKNPFSIVIKDSELCSRFAALYLSSVAAQASDLHTVVRLSRLDSRAIDFLVDATNYVMLDLGQPMHAFDADKLQKKQLTITRAQAKEKVSLLDGETIELTSEDIVIADGGTPISLAGVMGGATTALSSKTHSVLLEAAHFDPVMIRRTSAHHKKRTESSVRFEKNIDPCQNVDAIKRFLFLLDTAEIAYQAQDHIVSLGTCPEPKIIVVEHTFIEARLGVLIQPERVVEILEKLAFAIEDSVEDSNIIYSIIVPSFRATKDVKIPEDIVEEVGRYIGYDTLPRVMPSLQLRPSDLHATYTTRSIKRFLSYGLQMRELYGYSFFDETILRQLAWQPAAAVDIKNPISENYTRLVTTLQPSLLKAIAENSVAHPQLRFYEWARVWHMRGENIIEQKSLSGIFFSQKLDELDFYAGKALLTRLFDELHMSIEWHKSEKNGTTSWNMQYQTGELVHDDQTIGTAGLVEQSIITTLSPAGGSAFIFEINADYLLNYRKPIIRFTPLSKYPSVRRDVSILIPVAVTTDALLKMIRAVDNRIEDVTLIDFFEKPEWKDQKAMTFHVELCDREKTLTSQEVDGIWNRVVAQLQQQGAVIR